MQKYKLMKTSISLILVLSLGTITGCSKKKENEFEDISLPEVVTALNSEENLTTVDENMQQGLDGQTLEEIDNEYQEALKDGSLSKINKSLEKLSKLTLKSIIADNIGCNQNDIEDFEIVSSSKQDIIIPMYRNTVYGIKYKIKENSTTTEEHKLLGINKDAKKLLIICRAAAKNELSNEEAREIGGKTIPSITESYETIKETLSKKINKSDNKVISNNIKFNGMFEIQEDREKENVIKTYIKSRY